MGWLPFQEPDDAARTLPSRAVPEIVGAAEFTGAAEPTTTAVRSDVAMLLPATLRAVTRTRIVRPTSRSVAA